MSFVRINRRPLRTKKVSATKKEWVSTVNDLSVHKATQEDLSRRREMHRSRNKSLAQYEMRGKSQKRMQKKSQPDSPGIDQARLRIIREVFSDQCQLQDVLARSDRAMAVVKDLFGDAPLRQTGFPSVTLAPDYDSDSELPVLQKPDPPTQLSLLSQSMMDQQALNELEHFAGEHGEDHDASVSFSSEMCRPKRKTCKAKAPQWSKDQQRNLPQTPHNAAGAGDLAALNATVAVERLRSRQSQTDTSQSTTLVTQVLNPEPVSSHSGGKNRSSRTTTGPFPGTSGLESSGLSSRSANQSSLELLQDMLGQVETELACLEPQGPLASSEPLEQHRGRGLTGFSMALVTTLARITSHLRRREEEVQKEAQARRRLEEEMKEQRELIDALTAECFTLREESAALQTSLQERITELEQRLDMVILGLGELGSGGEQKESEGTVPSSDAKPVPADPPAVLLSPPRQKDSRGPPAAAHTRTLHFEGPQSTGSVYSMDSDGSCTPASFVSLPDSVLPRPAQLLDQPVQDAILQQIVELRSQNAAIQTQLGQFRPSSAGGSVFKEHSTDRLAPVSTKDRRTSPSSGQQPTQQCLNVADSSVRLMEEKMQELNRQSAAARAKLLELIEQQKQTASVSVSPSISPIPPHSTSPNTVAGRLNQDLCVSVPERIQLSTLNTNANRKSAGAVSPQNVHGAGSTTINTQVDKRKGEGWFALSAHIQ